MNGTFIDMDAAFYLTLIVGVMLALYWLASGE